MTNRPSLFPQRYQVDLYKNDDGTHCFAIICDGFKIDTHAGFSSEDQAHKTAIEYMTHDHPGHDWELI